MEKFLELLQDTDKELTGDNTRLLSIFLAVTVPEKAIFQPNRHKGLQ